MEVIKAGRQHIPMIQEIVDATWPVAYGDILSPEQIRYMIRLFYSAEALDRQIDQGHHFLLCLEEGAPLGFASFELNFDGVHHTKLHKLYVLPDTQGKGIGKLLLDQIITVITDQAEEQLFLNVNRHNKAIGFYKRYGFRIAGEEDIDIGNGYFMNDYVMVLTLLPG